MKFKFCGELDAPDWLLKEIELLSKISVVRIKAIIKELIHRLLTGAIDFNRIAKHTAKTDFVESEVKASIAALSFIITNGAKYDVEAATLSNELQQLGLPKEHAEALCRALTENKDSLRAKFHAQTLRVNQVESVDWRVDYVLASSSSNNVNAPTVQLCFNVNNDDGQSTKHAFEIDSEKFRVLLAELQTARAMMNRI